MKQKILTATNILVIIIGIIFIVAVTFYFLNKEFKFVGGGGEETNIDIHINVESDVLQKNESNNVVIEKSLCDLFVENYPTYFLVKEVQCGLVGGEYVCEQDRMGCYDITAWNSTLCFSTQAQALKALCVSLEGEWDCTATKISCER